MKTIKKLLALNLALLLFAALLPVQTLAATGDLNSGPKGFSSVGTATSTFTYTPATTGIYRFWVASWSNQSVGYLVVSKGGVQLPSPNFSYRNNSTGVTDSYAYLEQGTQYTIVHTPGYSTSGSHYYNVNVAADSGTTLTLDQTKAAQYTTPSDLFVFTPATTGWYTKTSSGALVSAHRSDMDYTPGAYDHFFMQGNQKYYFVGYNYYSSLSLLVRNTSESSFASLKEDVTINGARKIYRFTPEKNGEYIFTVITSTAADIHLYSETAHINWTTFGFEDAKDAYTASASLTADTPYYFSCDVGTAAYTINAHGTGPEVLADSMIAAIPDMPYTGSAITPEPVVKDGSKTLVKGTDFDYSYDKNTDVGTATVTITGKNGYTGTASKSFKIVGADYTYTVPETQDIKVGSGLSAITIVPAGGSGLGGAAVSGDHTWYRDSGRTVPATDADISAKTAGQTLTLYWSFAATTANYTTTPKVGSTVFTITEGDPQELAFAGITNDAVSKTFGDNDFTETATLSKGTGAISYASSDEAVATVDSATGKVTILKAGTAQITATAAAVPGAWAKTSISYTLTVNPKSLAGAVIANIEDVTYTGSAFTPEPTVTDSGIDLAKGTDFDYSYAKNTNAGTATVTVTGKGNYTGTATKDFTIKQAELTGKPVISGTAEVGNVLTASLEGIDANEFTWQWMRVTDEITGAVSPAYTVVIADSNKEITVVAEAVSTGNYLGTSDESDAVTVAKMAISGTVTLTEGNVTDGTEGLIEKGDVLTAAITGILPVEAQAGTFSYQWYLNGEEVGTNSQDYTVPEGEANDEITVTVTATGDFQGDVVSAPAIVGKKLLTGALIIDADGDTVDSEITFTKLDGLGDDDADYTWMRDGEEVAAASGSDPVYTITKADLGKSISVKITGKGDWAGEIVSNFIAIPVIAPEAPAVTAVAGNAQITVSWTAPFNGGTPITGYTVQLGEETPLYKSAGESSHTFTGLTNGQSYTVKVNAVNSAGAGAAGTATATPTAPAVDPGPVDPGPSGGTTPAPEATTIKAEAGSNAVSVTITQVGGEVTLLLPDSAVKSILKNLPEEDASVTFDLSKVKNADSAALPLNAVKTLGNEEVSVTLKLPAATLTLDAQALKSLAAEAKAGESLVIEAKEVAEKSLTDAQKALTAGKKVIDINIYLGKRKVDTPLTVSISYKLGANETAEGVTLWLMDGDTLTEVAGTYNAETGLFTFTIPHQSYYVIGYAEPAAQWPFTDVAEDSWFYEAVKYVYENGIMTGTSDTAFAPTSAMNRAMMVTVLYRMEGEPSVDGLDNPFADVPAGQWYTDAILWAAENGIVQGYSETAFGPMDNVTREQMVTILFRYAVFKELDVAKADELAAFADVADVSAYALDAVKWAVAEGYINGRTADTLAPKGTTNRAEIATVLQRFLSK